MIDRTHPLSITRQAQIVGISRGSVYYQREPVSDADLKLMRRIDELHLELPFAGARMLRDLLRAEGFTVGRKHMTTLMLRMGITALYRKPNTSKQAPGHTIWPYLLRTLAITRSNHVWAMDISYIPMARGFVYLAAVIDWHSRRVLAWRLSISMDTAFMNRLTRLAIWAVESQNRLNSVGTTRSSETRPRPQSQKASVTSVTGTPTAIASRATTRASRE